MDERAPRLPSPIRARGAVLETTSAPRPFSESRPLTVSDVELAPPGAGEVLVEIEAAGICHSDLSVLLGVRPRPVPMLLGHEAAGRIASIGAEVRGVAVGDRVTMTFMPRCGACAGCATDGKMPCVAGTAANGAGELLRGGRRISRDGRAVHHHLGVSGFATRAVVDARTVVPVPDDVPAPVAALLGCAVLTGGGALLNAAPPRPGQSVAVVGLGGVGLAAVLTARALGVERIVGVDADPGKLETALALGATEAYGSAEAEATRIRADIVVEAAGHERAFETAIALTAPGGTTVTVGLPAPDAVSRVRPQTVTAEARTIVGSYLGSAVPARDIPRYVELWRRGLLNVEGLISGALPLERINEGMDALAEGRALRQIITFERPSPAHVPTESPRTAS
ncbi:zinc-binding dehydrogenase [Leucobacter iarius]|uniref:Alcohol dehydrogenase catalytic domain-containing protein n=1 Tax=Leucobacter iarius TaxID=333963 RepID=A0ABP4Y0Y4_9MICO